MSNFSFYFGNEESIVNKLEQTSKFTWGEIIKRSFGPYNLFIPKNDFNDCYVESEDSLGVLVGTVRYNNNFYNCIDSKDINSATNKKFISDILKEKNWPISDNLTGSFTAASYSKIENKLVICNDFFSYQSIYYNVSSIGVIVSTNLIPLGKCISSKPDLTGILQSLIPHYYSFGNRTLIKDIFKLLPYEWKCFYGSNKKSKTIIDNTLYQDTLKMDIDLVSDIILDDLNKSIKLFTYGSDKVSLALSGGWDSRLLLPFFAKLKIEKNCLTYGERNSYESKIAMESAKSYGLITNYYPIETHIFPTINDLKTLVKSTGTVAFLVWNNIIQSFAKENNNKPLVFLGDYYDILDSRNYMSISNRDYRKKLFFKHLIGIKDKIKISNKTNFEKWKGFHTEGILKSISDCSHLLSNQLNTKLNMNIVIEETISDLDITYKYISNLNTPYVIQYDEIFRWLHYSKLYQHNQSRLLSNSFRPICPLHSPRLLRLSSNIHPNLKIRRRLLDAIINRDEYSKINGIPTPTIPFVPNTSPKLVKELIWGLRHYLDYFYLRRKIRTRDPNVKERFIKNIEFMKEYQRHESVKNVSEWFSGKWLNPESFIEKANDRADYKRWPQENNDILIPASISTTLDLIYN